MLKIGNYLTNTCLNGAGEIEMKHKTRIAWFLERKLSDIAGPRSIVALGAEEEKRQIDVPKGNDILAILVEFEEREEPDAEYDEKQKRRY